MGSADPAIEVEAYWNVNVPADERTAQCPAPLQNLSKKDIRILSTPDQDYEILSWPAVREIIATNRIDLFQRMPSDLRRYLCYNYGLKQQHGSVMAFVLTQRLQWDTPIVAEGARPFECAGDVKILWNDWPYGIDDRIVHLVVWTKFDLEEDPATGDLTEETRADVEDFVVKTFSPRLKRDQYIWFKNWKSLKSIHAVEHFHIMVFDPPSDFIDGLTGGDVPLCRKVKP